MRTKKRFSVAQMHRWSRNGRGQGVFSEYQPWHQVSRDDAASMGQSRIKYSSVSGRQHHLLSKIENHVFLFLTMMPAVRDIREQFALSVAPSVDERTHYVAGDMQLLPGTLALAARHQIRHPRIGAGAEREDWRLSTDQLALLVTDEAPALLAISVKSDAGSLSSRQRQLLAIEQHYWAARDAQWRLITRSDYDERVANGMCFLGAWALAETRVSRRRLEELSETLKRAGALSWIDGLRAIAQTAGEITNAQLAVAQAVWAGLLPLDLAALTGPTPRMQILTQEEFRAQNPLAAGRFSCL